jgi:hypothetical protein
VAIRPRLQPVQVARHRRHQAGKALRLRVELRDRLARHPGQHRAPMRVHAVRTRRDHERRRQQLPHVARPLRRHRLQRRVLRALERRGVAIRQSRQRADQAAQRRHQHRARQRDVGQAGPRVDRAHDTTSGSAPVSAKRALTPTDPVSGWHRGPLAALRADGVDAGEACMAVVRGGGRHAF